jgi:hypothetical protein
MAKIYKRVGIRRDFNLTDVSDTKASLNNLLDGLVSDLNSTFISEDLDAIRNIFSYDLSSDGYREIIGSRVQFTDNSGINQDFFPRITYQNRLDRFEIFSGTPRINGAAGLTADYYNQSQVDENTQVVFSGEPIHTDNFWEAGNFSYSGKITPQSVNVNGGVEWTGYFIPTTTGAHTFYVSTTALTSFEFETQGYTSGIGTYTEHIRVGLTSTFTATGTSGNDFITLSTPSDTNYIGIGQSVTASGIPAETEVEGYNRDTGVITLSANLTGNVSGNVVFSKAIGQSTQSNWTSYVLEQGRRYNIRYRYYIPQSIDAIGVDRSIDFNILYPSSNSTSNLRYNYLYALDYDFSDNAKGEFPLFLENSILAGGGLLGGTVSDDYVKVKSTKKVDIKYTPKTSYAAIEKSSVNITTTINTNVISISDTSNIEVGNYIFGTNIPVGTVVNQIGINEYIIISNPATGSGTVAAAFIDHRGFVKKVTGSISGNTLSVSSGNTDDLRTNMIVIGEGVTQYTGITTTSSGVTTVTVSPSQTVGVGATLFFYQSRGLINDSLDAFCNINETKCVVLSDAADPGDTILSVNNGYSGSINNWKVYGAQFAENTTVVSSTSSTVTINTGTISGIATGGNFTVTNAGVATSERALCCPPLDTSPPFNPTNEGLETTTSSPKLKIHGGNIKFDTFRATVTPSKITDTGSSDSSTKRLPIQTPSGTFNILCA